MFLPARTLLFPEACLTGRQGNPPSNMRWEAPLRGFGGKGGQITKYYKNIVLQTFDTASLKQASKY